MLKSGAVHEHEFKCKKHAQTAHNIPFLFVQKLTKFGLSHAVAATATAGCVNSPVQTDFQKICS